MPVRRDKTLECRSCRGYLVPDRYIDTEDECGHMWVRLLRCVRCGRMSTIETRKRTSLLQFSPFGNTVAGNYLVDDSTPLGI